MRWSLSLCAAGAGLLLHAATASAAVMAVYNFEDGTLGSAAAQITDSSGLGRNGTATTTGGAATAGAYVPGLYQNSTLALRLNSDGTTANPGLQEKVVLPGNTDFIRNAPGATLMAWVRTDGIPAASAVRTILSINNNDTTANSGQGNARATIQIVDSRFRALGREVDTGGSANAITGVNAVVAGQTYLVAGVFDYANNVIRLLVNGVQVATNTAPANWTTATTSSDTANLTAGLGNVAAPAAGQEYWTGAIDGARIFNTAFTNQQILDIYNAEVLPEPGMLSFVALAGLVVRRRSK